MPLSQLDKTPALVVIDMQKGIVGLPLVHSVREITENNAKLARAFRARGLPVVLVNVTAGAPGRTDVTHHFQPPPDWAQLVPELEEHPGDHKVTKLQWGAFHGTFARSFSATAGCNSGRPYGNRNEYWRGVQRQKCPRSRLSCGSCDRRDD